MGNILELAELVWKNLNPNGSAQTATKKEAVISDAIIEYSAAMWIFSKEQAGNDGGFEIPSEMIAMETLPAKDNMVDISSLKIMDSLPNDQGIQFVGDFSCPYIKSSLNQEHILKNDDSIGLKKTFYRTGKKLLFPRGTYKDEVSITYAAMGTKEKPNDIQANDYVLSKVRDKLYQLYGLKVPADHTENSNSNN